MKVFLLLPPYFLSKKISCMTRYTFQSIVLTPDPRVRLVQEHTGWWYCHQHRNNNYYVSCWFIIPIHKFKYVVNYVTWNLSITTTTEPIKFHVRTDFNQLKTGFPCLLNSKVLYCLLIVAWPGSEPYAPHRERSLSVSPAAVGGWSSSVGSL